MLTHAGQRPALNPSADREPTAQSEGQVRPDHGAVIADAWQQMREAGYPMRIKSVRRLHAMFLRRTRPIDDDDFRTWLLTYTDPTGETATCNAGGAA